MLITPIISGGIPEIPILDSNPEGLPIVLIPFKHHPSKTTATTIYVRVIDSAGAIYGFYNGLQPNGNNIELSSLPKGLKSLQTNTILKF